jgi:hypothetical protein
MRLDRDRGHAADIRAGDHEVGVDSTRGVRLWCGVRLGGRLGLGTGVGTITGIMAICLCDHAQGRCNQQPSDSRVPVIIDAIFPIASFAQPNSIERRHGPDVHDVFRVLVAELALNPQPGRRAMTDR